MVSQSVKPTGDRGGANSEYKYKSLQVDSWKRSDTYSRRVEFYKSIRCVVNLQSFVEFLT